MYSTSEAQRAASKKYLKDKVEDIRIRVPKGEKEKLKAHAEKAGMSLNAFILSAIRKQMKSDTE